MVKGKKEQKEQPIAEEPEEGTEAEPEALTKAVSQEEIDAQLAEATERGKAEAWAEYQGIQRVVSQKDQKIKELEEQIAQPSKATDDDLLQILIEDRKGRASEYGEADPVISKLEAVIAKRKQDQVQAQAKAYYNQCDAVYKKAVEAYGEDDVDNLFTIRTLIRARDFDLAEKKIAKATTKEPAKEKQEAEPKKDEYFVSEEAKRKWMEKAGMLESEQTIPSTPGSPRTKAEAAKLFVEGKLSDKDYSQWRHK